MASDEKIESEKIQLKKFDKAGKAAGDMEVEAGVFGIEPNVAVG